ncbi:hypothetical protein ACPZ19_42460 [Amycolatopsis lurida]
MQIAEEHLSRLMHDTNTDQAAAAGLRCRPMEQTVADWATPN